MEKPETSLDSFSKGITCSAAVFSAFSSDMGLDEKTARKIACGFGAGISRTGNICGAVSGAIMVIGLKYGKEVPGDDGGATEKTRALTRQFVQEFEQKHGSVNCTKILGYNLSVPAEYDEAAKANLFRTKCPSCVRDATEILERIL
ncbi:C-GCAxxG-C-C family protein [Methanoregula sp. PtaB.Bin085]|uniref:C-GCAxxG-C-C family protein n=1 Tax=Methanoregula sp. PtaB.Bin085 TaxID=1811680 RepID=UPI0009CCEB79|nr:C-GCAxxG-C-C family protein [Methanoregula sp. PtaB.Bin085]OPX64810.1 MAG: putative redox-active protein (C_GCAxxG_C_C) [Methanoregula sp. PtaB.Bin085]